MKVFVLLGYFLCAFSLSSKEVDLEELKQMALNSNFGIKSNQVNVQLSEAEVALARSKFYPRLGIEAGKEWIRSRVSNEDDDLVSVYGEINLFNGLKDSSLLKKKKVHSESIKKQLSTSKFNLALKVEKVFYNYILAKKKLEINLSEISRIRAHSKLVKKRYSSKLITESDNLEFQLHQNKIQSKNHYLILENEQLLSKLHTIVGIKDSGSLTIAGSIPHLKIKPAQSQVLGDIKNGPSLSQLQFKQNEIEIDQTSANSGWFPSINLKAEHGRLDEVETGISSSEKSSRIALTATWELFSGLETVSQRDLSSLSKTKVEYARKQAEQDLSIEVSSNFKTLKILEKTIDFEEENERLAQKLYRKTLQDYRKGIKDSGALIDASQKITDAQTRVYELKLNYIFTKISLEKILGQSLEFTIVDHHREN